MLGMLVGAFFMGMVSDAFGRKVGIMISALMVATFGTAAAFTTSFYAFGFLRFLTGMGGMGLYMVAYVYALEITTPEKKIMLSLCTAFGWTLGTLIYALESYLIRDWFTLQLVSFAPAVLVFLLWFLIPESIRWLVNKNRTEEAQKVLEAIAKENGAALPEGVFDTPLAKTRSFRTLEQAEEKEKATLRDIFTPLPILLRSLNMAFQWFSVTMSFFGISFTLTALSGNPYLNFFLGGLVEIPAILIALFFVNFVGRRLILVILQAVAGFASLSAGLLVLAPELVLLRTVLALVGKIGATSAFLQVYLYTAGTDGRITRLANLLSHLNSLSL